MQLRDKLFDKRYQVHGKFLRDELGSRHKWLTRLLLAILGEGATGCWFEYKETSGVEIR
jgi:hypothetical protein